MRNVGVVGLGTVGGTLLMELETIGIPSRCKSLRHEGIDSGVHLV